MTRHRRDWSFGARLHYAFWTGETKHWEQCVAVAGLLRGLWMLNPMWYSIPIEVQGNLIPPSLPEPAWGAWIVSLAIGQFYVAGQRGPFRRSIAATLFAVTQGAASIGYWNADLFYRGVVPFILSMMLVELWVAYRALRDRIVSSNYAERRDAAVDG